ncbi:MAG: OmpA family protein, partial [Myxococcota bacterium]
MEEVTAARAEIRRRRRIVEPHAQGWKFWAWVLPLGALLLLGGSALAARWIEDDVLEAARKTLSPAEREWAQLEVRGRELIASGQAPSGAAAAAVIDRLRASQGRTILGSYQAPRRVVARFEAPSVASCTPCAGEGGETTRVEAAPQSGALEEVPTSSVAYFLRRSEGVLVLIGRVENADARDKVLARAEELLGTGEPPLRRIEDHLAWAGGPPTPQRAWLGGVEVLGLCREGRLEPQATDDGALNVLCVAPDAHRARIEELLSGDAFRSLFALQTSLLSAEEVDACEAGLGALLAGTVIEFDTASARLRSSAFELLDRVAETAQECPGRLRIEGHTDHRGDDAYNLDLSQRRAESVAT